MRQHFTVGAQLSGKQEKVFLAVGAGIAAWEQERSTATDLSDSGG